MFATCIGDTLNLNEKTGDNKTQLFETHGNTVHLTQTYNFPNMIEYTLLIPLAMQSSIELIKCWNIPGTTVSASSFPKSFTSLLFKLCKKNRKI